MQQPKIFNESESATGALADVLRELVTRKISTAEISPGDSGGEVTHSVGGKACILAVFPSGLYKRVFDRIKVVGNLRPEEGPQRGSWEMDILDKKIHIEAMMVPVAAGEKIILDITYL